MTHNDWVLLLAISAFLLGQLIQHVHWKGILKSRSLQVYRCDYGTIIVLGSGYNDGESKD